MTLRCEECKGSGVVDRWERLPLKPEFANGYGVAQNFYHKCQKCDEARQRMAQILDLGPDRGTWPMDILDRLIEVERRDGYLGLHRELWNMVRANGENA